MRKRYTTEDIDLIKRLNLEGLTCSEIAKELGVTVSAIQHVMSRRKIKFCYNPYVDLEGEVWKPTTEDVDVEVSNLGRFKRVSSQSLLNPWAGTQGYLYIDLGGGTLSAHRIVAREFIPNPDNKPEVNHINGNKGDNRVENLEWVTPSENVRHSYDVGLKIPKTGFEHHRAAITWEQAKQCYDMRNQGMTYEAIGKLFGSTRHTISKYVKIYRRSTECSETIETTP